MIKIIFFDIDGTLRPFETGVIPEKSRQAIRAARESGILTCIATGRHWLELHTENLIDHLPFDAFVTLDGNYCYILPEGSSTRQHSRIFGSASAAFPADDCYFDPQYGTVLHKSPIPQHTIRTLADFLSEHSFPVIFEEERRIYVNYVNDDLRRSFDAIHSPIPELGLIEDALENPIYMLIPILPYADSLHLSARLPECQIVRWSDGLSFDLTPRGIDKVYGVDRVLQHYGIDRSETAAIGDGLNDIDMLRHVGLGIAMGNAKDKCKQAADYVAPHILSDGLSHAVELILERNRREGRYAPGTGAVF